MSSARRAFPTTAVKSDPRHSHPPGRIGRHEDDLTSTLPSSLRLVQQRTFIQHSRHLVKEERELQHKMTSLKHPDSKVLFLFPSLLSSPSFLCSVL